MAEQPAFQHSALQEYVVDANEVLRFKLVKSAEDMDDSSLEFGPEMCHQTYGDNENIFGYRGLKIQLYMSASGLRSYVSSDHTDKVHSPTCLVTRSTCLSSSSPPGGPCQD